MLDFQVDNNIDLVGNDNNLVFIDSNVEGGYDLISQKNDNTEVIILDPNRDGIQQISEVLVSEAEVSSIHLVSHGQPGKINLGNAELSLDTWDTYQDRLQNWSDALTETADIIVYGCNVGANNSGRDLIDAMAEVTMADVAASDDLTGSDALGGDWEWEVNTGEIESQLPFTDDAIANYREVLMTGMSDMSGMSGMSGHQAFLDLVPHEQATHVAIKNGQWFDPNTWNTGEVPGDGANVVIPQGRWLFYGKESDTRLNTLRVDGSLRFASHKDTKMLIDTFVVSPEGRLVIGRKDQPIRAKKTARIIFTSDTAIDTEWDPTQISRGLISHGNTQIHGADKLDHVALKGDALKGDDELILDLPDGQTSPKGWRVGDRLVLGGTKYRHHGSDDDNTRFHDEELTITAIEGNRISFTNDDITSGDNSVLRFDRKRPEGFEDRVDLYVANTTRNVIFETENGDSVPTKQRGHVMLMHNPNIAVHNAEFYNLGRTDKNQLIDDPGQNIDGSVGSGKNPRGRYALHLHKIGQNDPNSIPVMAKGNAIVNSPGWGLVHHASNAVLEDNVVFDVVGAGIVAEAGNELGAWRNNITIKMTGDDRRENLDLNGPREFQFDFGFNGEGYWVQGAAQIAMEDNIAVSSQIGVALFGSDEGSEHLREVQTIPVANLPSQLSEIAKNTEDTSVVDVTTVPLRKLSGFESYNSSAGIFTWSHMPNRDGQLEQDFRSQGKLRPAHNFRTVIDDFKVWNVTGNGVNLSYSSQIDLKDGLILGKPQRKNSSGVNVNDSSTKLHFNNLHIENFVNGLRVPYDAGKDFAGSSIEGSYFVNNQQNFAPTSGQLVVKSGEEDFPTFFQIRDNNVFQINDNVAPQAKFSSQAIGGLARSFDASASFDPDSTLIERPSEGIVSYGWDFDNDGEIDKFGSQVSHYFDRVGSHDITLRVWDNQGASDDLTKTISVQQTNYENAVINSGFDSLEQFASFRESNSAYVNSGWFATNAAYYDSQTGNGGAAILTSGKSRSTIGQVLEDDYVRRGKQTFSLDVKNKEGITKVHGLNKITVKVWGIDGEFGNKPYFNEGPIQVGALPMKSNQLLEQTVGGSNFDWQTFSWDVDLGDGYQFLLVQISGSAIGNDNDYVAIDNVRLV